MSPLPDAGSVHSRSVPSNERTCPADGGVAASLATVTEPSPTSTVPTHPVQSRSLCARATTWASVLPESLVEFGASTTMLLGRCPSEQTAMTLPARFEVFVVQAIVVNARPGAAPAPCNGIRARQHTTAIAQRRAVRMMNPSSALLQTERDASRWVEGRPDDRSDHP